MADRRTLRVYAAMHAHIGEGFVWLKDADPRPRRIVKITNRENGKQIYCEALRFDPNFTKVYNEGSARIKIEDKAMWITDLGSANGTQVNNKKLDPHHEYPLGDKDVVRLGRFSIQALVGE